MSMNESDFEELTRPGGIVPVTPQMTAKLVQEVVRLRAALTKIAGLDYRGNRPEGSVIAFEALRAKG